MPIFTKTFRKSLANPSFPTQFGIGDGGSPEAFVGCAEVREVPDIGVDQQIAEVTNMSSINGWQEYIVTGIKGMTEFTLPLNFVADDADQVSLVQQRAAVTSGQGKYNYAIKFTDVSETVLVFEAVITSAKMSASSGDAAMLSVTFQPTGAWAWVSDT